MYQCGTNSCEKNPNDNVKLNNLNWNGSISGIKCSGIIGIVKEQ